MTTRTITTTLKRANDTAWAGAVITAALRTRFTTTGGITPPDVVAVTTDAGGAASLILAVPDAGTAEYYVTLPNGGGGSIYVAAGATTTLGALLASSAPVSVSAIAEHAALVASGSVLGHVKIGSGITVAADGTISAAGGGGGSSPIATPTVTGTVKIATAAADPIVYRSADVDTLLLGYLLSSSYTWSTLPGKPSAFAPSAHAASHASGGGDVLALAQSQITSLVGDLAAKAASADLAAHTALATTAHGGIVASSDTRLTDARTPTSHSHADATISTAGFLSAVDKTKLDGVAALATANRTDAAADAATASAVSTHNADATTHGQTTAGRTLLTAATAALQRTALSLGSAALSAVADFAAAIHTHAAGDIASGTLDALRLPALGNSLPFRARAFGADAWTAMPAALTELYGSSSGRIAADLTGAREARIVARVSPAGFAGSELRLQYSTNGGSTWAYADGTSAPSLSLTTSGTTRGAWATLVAGAKADVDLRLVGINGDGVVAPSFGTIVVQVR